MHRKTGFLVQNVDEMVRFIPRIAEIDREVTRMHVERNFSVRVMAEKYMKIYNQVIKMAEGVPARPFFDTVLSKSITAIEAVPSAVKKVAPAQVARAVRVVAEAKTMN